MLLTHIELIIRVAVKANIYINAYEYLLIYHETGDANRAILDQAPQRYNDIARDIISGRSRDPTGGATHYHVNNPRVG